MSCAAVNQCINHCVEIQCAHILTAIIAVRHAKYIATRGTRRLRIVERIANQQHFIGPTSNFSHTCMQWHRVWLLFRQGIAGQNQLKIIMQAGIFKQGQGKFFCLVGNTCQPVTRLLQCLQAIYHARIRAAIQANYCSIMFFINRACLLQTAQHLALHPYLWSTHA